MRKLHLVGLTTDRDGLIFTARKGSKSGGFIVPLDKKVLAAIAEAGSNGEPAAAAVVSEHEVVPKRLRSESALTPREMQARLRAGRTIEEVAAEAGVDTEWVARFAVPILAEQAQVVELARALVYAKPRLGESTQPLGASVMQNLADKGVFLLDDVAAAGWSAFQLHDSVWLVRFRYRARGRDQEAQWELDVPTGRLRARNRHASDLGYVGPDRWRLADDVDEAPVEEEPPAPARPARRRAAPNATTPVRKRPSAKAVKAPATPVKAQKAPKAVAKSVRTAPARKAASPRTASAKPTTRRRPTKAEPAPEAGPGVGSGGVRMAVAQVSTARVAASMATADREPWAVAATGRRGRPSAAASTGGGATLSGRRRPVPQPAPSGARDEPAPRTFQPRPLPPPGSEPLPPRVRKVTVPRPQRPSDGPPAVSLPAPRRQTDKTEPIPVIDRPKRRRLRSR